MTVVRSAGPADTPVARDGVEREGVEPDGVESAGRIIVLPVAARLAADRAVAPPDLETAAASSMRSADGIGEAATVLAFPRARPGAGHADAISFGPAEAAEPAMPPRATSSVRWAVLLGLSAAIHLLLVLPFWRREPAPLASVGEVAISVELVLGSRAPAGLAAAPAESESVASPPAAELEPKAAQSAEPEPARPAAPVTADAAAESSDRPAEAAPAPAAASVDQPTQAAVTDPSPATANASPVTADAETPVTEQAVAEQAAAAPPAESTPSRQQTAQAKPVVQPARAATPKPQPKLAAIAPEPRQRITRAPAPRRQAAREDTPARQRAARNQPATTTARPAAAANGVGVGRSDASTNYRGLVAAHLARYKHYPAEARGGQGTAGVTFSLSGSGSVAAVSLSRPSGVPGFDQEALAMVRRASPFPPPPDGRRMSFTVPVTFRPL